MLPKFLNDGACGACDESHLSFSQKNAHVYPCRGSTEPLKPPLQGTQPVEMTSSATKVTFYKEQMKEGLNLKKIKTDNLTAGI